MFGSMHCVAGQPLRTPPLSPPTLPPLTVIFPALLHSGEEDRKRNLLLAKLAKFYKALLQSKEEIFLNIPNLSIFSDRSFNFFI